MFSPVYTPRYNGTTEAGIGALKTGTHQQAAQRGNPGVWTCADMEAALWGANTLAYPFGENEPTAEEVWQQRQPLTDDERRCFDETLKARYEEMEREQESAREGEGSSMTKAKRQREATSRALVDLGYLNCTTRRIPPPILRRKVT